MYLQSLDIVINKPFKDHLRVAVNEYIEHRMVRNQRGNLTKPKIDEVTNWVSTAWSKITNSIVNNALIASYLTPQRNFTETFIYQHEKYGPLIASKLASNDFLPPTDILIPEENDLDVFSDESEAE